MKNMKIIFWSLLLLIQFKICAQTIDSELHAIIPALIEKGITKPKCALGKLYKDTLLLGHKCSVLDPDKVFELNFQTNKVILFSPSDVIFFCDSTSWVCIYDCKFTEDEFVFYLDVILNDTIISSTKAQYEIEGDKLGDLKKRRTKKKNIPYHW